MPLCSPNYVQPVSTVLSYLMTAYNVILTAIVITKGDILQFQKMSLRCFYDDSKVTIMEYYGHQ